MGTSASAVSGSGLESNDLLLLWFLQERRMCPPSPLYTLCQQITAGGEEGMSRSEWKRETSLETFFFKFFLRRILQRSVMHCGRLGFDIIPGRKGQKGRRADFFLFVYCVRVGLSSLLLLNHF